MNTRVTLFLFLLAVLNSKTYAMDPLKYLSTTTYYSCEGLTHRAKNVDAPDPYLFLAEAISYYPDKITEKLADTRIIKVIKYVGGNLLGTPYSINNYRRDQCKFIEEEQKISCELGSVDDPQTQNFEGIAFSLDNKLRFVEIKKNSRETWDIYQTGFGETLIEEQARRGDLKSLMRLDEVRNLKDKYSMHCKRIEK